MLIIALVLAVIGLAALVFAVVTSNELIAWVCIGASALGVVLLIIDALQERKRREAGAMEALALADSELDLGEADPGDEQLSGPSGDEVHYADYPEDDSDVDDDVSLTADSGSDEGPAAEYERGGTVRDDQNTR
jgi:hypothetical protein